ncbi:MAG: hypothetical protein O4808_22200 [Trichodesmium sp. St17_bin3_1_1]|jgi:hypothetical protein|nr:hypothetical protein [Trichodesmium sp. St17_bin3_1_1]
MRALSVIKALEQDEAYLIFDDTVINKKYGYNIEITRREYSGNKHQA